MAHRNVDNACCMYSIEMPICEILARNHCCSTSNPTNNHFVTMNAWFNCLYNSSCNKIDHLPLTLKLYYETFKKVYCSNLVYVKGTLCCTFQSVVHNIKNHNSFVKNDILKIFFSKVILRTACRTSFSSKTGS